MGTAEQVWMHRRFWIWRKRALVREHSVADISRSTISIGNKTTKLVAPGDAVEGPDLWKDGDRKRLFLSQRLRDALVGSGLRIAGLDWLRPAAVFAGDP